VLSSFPKKSGRTPLLFVHRTFILLRCGKPLAADTLLGCFLPRLGPLVATQAASFLVYFRVLRVSRRLLRNGERTGTTLDIDATRIVADKREAHITGKGEQGYWAVHK
jgi:hypothetical protein